MNLKKIIIPFFVLGLMFQSCDKSKKEIFWISGFKTTEMDTVGSLKNLYIHKGEDLTQGKWEVFNSPIEGYNFEEGFLKKVQIIETKLKKTAENASKFNYKLNKDMERKEDNRILLNGDWILTDMNGKPIKKDLPTPRLGISLNELRISGNGGCNRYFATINNLSLNEIQFGEIASTLMACLNDNFESEYLMALRTIQSYTVENKVLKLQDETGVDVLVFKKDKTIPNTKEIAGNWLLTSLEGSPINRMVVLPTLVIQDKGLSIGGNGGCNDYNGTIISLDKTSITFRDIAVTLKNCDNANIEEAYFLAFSKIKKYKVGNDELFFYDENGNTLLSYIRVDVSEQKPGMKRPAKITLDESVNNQVFELEIGQPIYVHYRENASVGTGWDATNDIDGIVSVEKEYLRDEAPEEYVGVGGTNIEEIIGLEEGTVTRTYTKYYRGNIETVITLIFKVK